MKTSFSLFLFFSFIPIELSPFSQILHQYCGSRLQRPHLPWPESGLSIWGFLTQNDYGCTILKERAGIVHTA